jgi:RNA polymerase sigma-70 factor (ECF subfamily)
MTQIRPSMLKEKLDFREIVDLYSAEILDRALQFLDDPRDAEEALQDILMYVYEGLKDFRGECEMKTWIHRMTTNHCLNVKKRPRPAEESVNEIDEETEVAELAKSPEDEYLGTLGEAEVRTAISRLPDKQAEAVTLFCLEGMSYSEIAEIMGIPIGSVATCVSRGRRHIYVFLYGRRHEMR